MNWKQLANDIFNGVVNAGAAILEASKPVIKRIVDASERVVRAVRRAFQEPPKSDVERIERDLADVNRGLQELEQRYQQRGALSQYEEKSRVQLREQRKALHDELRAYAKLEAAEQLVDKGDDFDVLSITGEQAHVLQHFVGQQTFDKICPTCSRPMVLQWERGVVVTNVGKFFWGCTGYYSSQCDVTVPLTNSDLRIFGNLKRSEFQLSPTELDDYVRLKNPKRVQDALRSLRNKDKLSVGVNAYRCPIHGERLVMREKKDAQELLDQFFLGCPRWLPDKTGCNFVTKLKSAAQISAVLDAGGHGGVIQLLEVRSRAAKPAQAGKPWRSDDDAMLLRLFDSGVTVPQLALSFQRNTVAIATRLQKLGRQPADEFMWRGSDAKSS